MGPTKAAGPDQRGDADGAREFDPLGGTVGSFATTNRPKIQQGDSPLAAALDYAAQGFAVFPCWPRSKTPAVKRGFKDATTNPATIRRWWLADATYNIAVATGIVSGVLILDVDGAIGATTLHDLEAAHGSLPVTSCSITSAGCHLWFRISDNVQSTAGRVGRGLDIRADGGYVIAPPSIHPDGVIYRWSNAAALAAAPAWLIGLTRPKPASISARATLNMRRSGPADAYGQAALDREIKALAAALPGARNQQLNRASFALHQLVAGGELDGELVHQHLIAATIANGLMTDPHDGPRSVERTIASGRAAGLQHPRSRGGA